MLRRLRSTSVLLALGYMGLFALSTLLLVGFLWWRTAGYLESKTEAAINADTNQVGGLLHDFGLTAAEDAIRVRIAESPHGHALFLLADKHLLPLAGNIASWPAEAGAKPGWYQFNLQRDDQLRPILFRSVALPGGMRLLIGREDGDRAEIRTLIIDALSWAGATSLLLAIGGGLLVRRSVLRRVEVINRTASAIVRGDLSRRLPTRDSTDEFDQLAQTINTMLRQIEDLVEGIRNTSNAVAHDLRTPLTELRAELEGMIRARTSRAHMLEGLHKAVADIDRVIGFFNALLRLVEIDSGVRRSGFRQFDLAQIATEVAELYGPLGEEKHAEFVVDAPRGLLVNGDPHLLAQAIGNLVDNAVKYTPPGGAVALRIRSSPGALIEIAVADNGPGIADIDKPRVTERFYRCRDTCDATGLGLGLSVVDAIARLHDGALILADNHPGLVASLRIPAAACAATQRDPDSPLPDLPLPDLALPDLALPDLPLLDLSPE
jgi:signal transduction histidine kinase